MKKDDDQTRYETQQDKEEPSANMEVVPNDSSSASSDLVQNCQKQKTSPTLKLKKVSNMVR